MPRKPRRSESFQQFLAAMEPADPHEQWIRVVEPGVIDQHGGARWQLKRGHLDVRVARRLAASASLMVVRSGASTRLQDVPVDQRADAWARAELRYEGPGGVIKGPEWPIEPVYNAYEFESDDGRPMLLLDEIC